MPETTCPSCGHRFHATGSATGSASASPTATPDPSVVQWFRGDPAWTGEASTDEIYGSYLRATDGTPVSRGRFVADLAYLGVDEVLDDDTPMLVRT